MDRTSTEDHAAMAVQQLHRLQEPEPAVFMRLRSVLRVTGLSRSTIYRLIADRQFPRPVQLGRRAVAWRTAEVAAWSEHRPMTVKSAAG